MKIFKFIVIVFLFFTFSLAIADEDSASVTVEITTGTITADDCIIPLNSSSCSSSVNWSITNPTNPSVRQETSQFSTSSSGNTNRTIQYGTTTFYVYDGSFEINQDTATASCGSNTWDGSKCATATNPDLTAGSVNGDGSVEKGSTENYSAIISNQGSGSTGSSFNTRFPPFAPIYNRCAPKESPRGNS